jgi:NDP-sugar pyrophosphorylase family protein
MQAVIIADGFGKRLSQIKADCLRSLSPMPGRTFIDYQLNLLKEGSRNDFVLCLGHRSQQIAEHCGDGSQFGLNMISGAMRLAEPLLEEPIITIYSDYVFIDCLGLFSLKSEKNTMGVWSFYKNQNIYDNPNAAIVGSFITFYRKNQCEDLQFINYGFNVFRKEVLNLIPKSILYSIRILFNELIERCQLFASRVGERFYKAGSVKNLEEFTIYMRGDI